MLMGAIGNLDFFLKNWGILVSLIVCCLISKHTEHLGKNFSYDSTVDGNFLYIYFTFRK